MLKPLTAQSKKSKAKLNQPIITSSFFKAPPKPQGKQSLTVSPPVLATVTPNAHTAAETNPPTNENDQTWQGGEEEEEEKKMSAS